MRTEGGRESSNVEDRRDQSYSGGGRGGMPLLGGKLGLGTIVIALVASWLLGINPMTVLSLLSGGDVAAPVRQSQAPAQAPPKDDALARFVSIVLADTEDVWKDLFARAGKQYVEPKLVLFRGTTPTACGAGEAAMGPFYCPPDQKVYIDLSFYEEMKTRFRAPGDFAQAYVIAHEVGHHVQNLLGIAAKVDAMRRKVSERDANALSVRMELQADCFAGVWAHHANRARQIIESGDIEEALNAATAIGDDTLQRDAGRAVRPDSFTHGSAAQRVRWFKTGITSGDLRQCDTFAARQL
ncbi:MAG: neutral zinc metallopeptidase [Burkholderiales bacterium]|nr:neutral zinc metallopeptidase [Burkholderiales bacterium]